MRPLLALGFVCVILVLPIVRLTVAADDLDNFILEGNVRDSTGASIEGAVVVVNSSATGLELRSVTDSEGRFRLTLSQPGPYVLRVCSSGFTERSLEGVALSGRRQVEEVRLEPAGVSIEVSVKPEGNRLVDPARTVVGETFGSNSFESIPLFGQDPLKMVLLMGGATEAPLSTSDLADEGPGVFVRSTPEEAGIFSLAGAPATSNNFTVDGLDNNDDRTARERISLSIESVAEVQVITNQYAAEYGRASGGRINLKTKSGSNAWRGDASIVFGDESLNANSFFRNARGLKRLPQQRYRAAGLMSGPLRANSHFVLFSLERIVQPDSAEIRALVPVLTQPAFPLPLPNQPGSAKDGVGLFFDEISTPDVRWLSNLRLDFWNSLNARLDVVRGSNKRGFPGGSRLPASMLVESRNSDSISLSQTWIPNSHLFNQARFQFSRLLPRNRPRSAGTEILILEPARIVAGPFSGSESAPAFTREETRLQVQETVTAAFGNHVLKTGTDIQLIRSEFTDLFATGGQFTFESVAKFLAAKPRRFVQRFDTDSRLANNVVGVFIQDEWRFLPNLTLSFGGRWDNESIVADRNNISPRLSVAWDPLQGSGSGKTVIRAGFGIFYNRALLRTLDDFKLGKQSFIVDSDFTPSLLALTRFPTPLFDRSLAERLGVRQSDFLRKVNDDLKVPYTIQTGLGVERQLGRGLLVTADYVFTRGAHLWRESNINAPVLPPGFRNFTEYLLSRDFDNRNSPDGSRPISSANADIVRFNLGAGSASTVGAVKLERGARVLTLGLNAPRSTNLAAALNAVRFLRPDPALGQVELLESTGNSFYHAGIFSARYTTSRVVLRLVYTLSKLIDEGTTNTASPQELLDRRAERSISLQDQRHRISFYSQVQVPYIGVDVAPVIQIGSSRPFNIGVGFDRNLNDLSNDRPVVKGDLARPVWRRPGQAEDVSGFKRALSLAPIGSSGNLPRNFGVGPATGLVNLKVSRIFRVKEQIRIRPAVEAYNLLNQTVFSFGSEFIDRDDVDFLVPRRTQRPRSIEVSLKLTF